MEIDCSKKVDEEVKIVPRNIKNCNENENESALNTVNTTEEMNEKTSDEKSETGNFLHDLDYIKNNGNNSKSGSADDGNGIFDVTMDKVDVENLSISTPNSEDVSKITISSNDEKSSNGANNNINVNNNNNGNDINISDLKTEIMNENKTSLSNNINCNKKSEEEIIKGEEGEQSQQQANKISNEIIPHVGIEENSIKMNASLPSQDKNCADGKDGEDDEVYEIQDDEYDVENVDKDHKINTSDAKYGDRNDSNEKEIIRNCSPVTKSEESHMKTISQSDKNYTVCDKVKNIFELSATGDILNNDEELQGSEENIDTVRANDDDDDEVEEIIEEENQTNLDECESDINISLTFLPQSEDNTEEIAEEEEDEIDDEEDSSSDEDDTEDDEEEEEEDECFDDHDNTAVILDSSDEEEAERKSSIADNMISQSQDNMTAQNEPLAISDDDDDDIDGEINNEDEYEDDLMDTAVLLNKAQSTLIEISKNTRNKRKASEMDALQDELKHDGGRMYLPKFDFRLKAKKRSIKWLTNHRRMHNFELSGGSESQYEYDTTATTAYALESKLLLPEEEQEDVDNLILVNSKSSPLLPRKTREKEIRQNKGDSSDIMTIDLIDSPEKSTSPSFVTSSVNNSLLKDKVEERKKMQQIGGKVCNSVQNSSDYANQLKQEQHQHQDQEIMLQGEQQQNSNCKINSNKAAEVNDQNKENVKSNDMITVGAIQPATSSENTAKVSSEIKLNGNAENFPPANKNSSEKKKPNDDEGFVEETVNYGTTEIQKKDQKPIENSMDISLNNEEKDINLRGEKLHKSQGLEEEKNVENHAIQDSTDEITIVENGKISSLEEKEMSTETATENDKKEVVEEHLEKVAAPESAKQNKENVCIRESDNTPMDLKKSSSLKRPYPADNDNKKSTTDEKQDDSDSSPPVKKLRAELENINLQSQDRILSEYIEKTSTSNTSADEIQKHINQLYVEIHTINDMMKAKEIEWNNMLHLKKVKEEILNRLLRKKQVMKIMSTKLGEPCLVENVTISSTDGLPDPSIIGRDVDAEGNEIPLKANKNIITSTPNANGSSALSTNAPAGTAFNNNNNNAVATLNLIASIFNNLGGNANAIFNQSLSGPSGNTKAASPIYSTSATTGVATGTTASNSIAQSILESRANMKSSDLAKEKANTQRLHRLLVSRNILPKPSSSTSPATTAAPGSGTNTSNPLGIMTGNDPLNGSMPVAANLSNLYASLSAGLAAAAAANGGQQQILNNFNAADLTPMQQQLTEIFNGTIGNHQLSSQQHQQNSGVNANSGQPLMVGRQGVFKDVKSIIAEYKQRHPEVVPRRGRRVKSNPSATASGIAVSSGNDFSASGSILGNALKSESKMNSNDLGTLLTKFDGNSRPSSNDSSHSMSNLIGNAQNNPNLTGNVSFKDVLVQFAKISGQTDKLSGLTNASTSVNKLSNIGTNQGGMQPYPEVTLHPVSTPSNSESTGSLLHGILTKCARPNTTSTLSAAATSQSPSTTQSTSTQNFSSSFSPTLARLLTAPERLTSTSSSLLAATAASSTSTSSPSTTNQNIAQNTYQGISGLHGSGLNLSKVVGHNSEITITPVVSSHQQLSSSSSIQQSFLHHHLHQQQQHQQHQHQHQQQQQHHHQQHQLKEALNRDRIKPENFMNIDEEADDSVDRLVIDEGGDSSGLGETQHRIAPHAIGQEFHENEVPMCQGCKKQEAQFVCAGCGNQWYCSRDCQVVAWDEHSEVCTG